MVWDQHRISIPTATACGQPHPHHRETRLSHKMAQEVQPSVAHGDVSFPSVFYPLFPFFFAPLHFLIHPVWDMQPSTPKNQSWDAVKPPTMAPSW